jgi:hypothetical protein
MSFLPQRGALGSKTGIYGINSGRNLNYLILLKKNSTGRGENSTARVTI